MSLRPARAAAVLRTATYAALTLLALVRPDAARAQGFESEVAFLTVPMGARIVGMGRAAVSIRGELQGVRWNPGTLGSVAGLEPLASHYSGPLDFKFNYLAVAIPAGSVGTFAVAADVQSFGEISLSDAPGVSLGTITPNNLVLSLTYGRELLARFDVGVTAKWIRSELSGELTGNTFAFDAGLLWKPLDRIPLDLGASVLNLGPGLSLEADNGGEPSPLPGRFRLGASYDLLRHFHPEGRFNLLVAIDLERAVRDLGTGSQFLGAELGVAGVLFLRGGYIAETLIETNKGTTLGIGLLLGGLQLDLARELGVNQLGDETHLSIAAKL